MLDLGLVHQESKQRDRGVGCSVRDSALQQLASIVRGADTASLDLTPQSAGLYAISLGLSRNFSDDHEMLRHGLVVYDALYAWCESNA